MNILAFADFNVCIFVVYICNFIRLLRSYTKKCQHPKLINFFDYYNEIRVNKYRQNSTSTFSQLRPSWEDNRFFTRERAKLSAAASTIFEASYKEKTFTLLTVNVYATTDVLDPVAGEGSASNDAAACRIYIIVVKFLVNARV